MRDAYCKTVMWLLKPVRSRLRTHESVVQEGIRTALEEHVVSLRILPEQDGFTCMLRFSTPISDGRLGGVYGVTWMGDMMPFSAFKESVSGMFNATALALID